MRRNELMKVKTDSGEIELSIDIIRNQIAKGDNFSDAEIINFMMLCKYRKLNPFLGQAYLVKFKDNAEMIVGKDVFSQRLNNNPLCEGLETGVIYVTKDNKIERRTGTFLLESDILVGAYCTIYRKGWKNPFDWTISFKDYYRQYKDKKSGKLVGMGNWAKMPAVMLVKCAMVSCVRNVFPEDFGGMYDADEIGVDMSNAIDITPTPVNEEPVVDEIISEKDIEDIKKAAESNDSAANKSFDSEKLLDFCMDKLIENGKLKSKNLEDIPKKQLKNVINYISTVVRLKEKQFFDKNGIKDNEEKKKADNKNDESDFEEMPVKQDFAKPATKTKTKKENESNSGDSNEK